jgi:hypothetical protein
MDGSALDTHLRAGVALYTDGYHHAAHDPWETAWLAAREDPADAALFQGLVQVTAATHHAREGNTEGARGLAESATGYLDRVPAGHRGVDLAPLGPYLASLAADPTDPDPPPLRVDGRRRGLADLEFPAVAVAAPGLAEALGLDPSVAERAVEYARTDLEHGRSGFVDSLLAFVGTARGADEGDETDGSPPPSLAYDRLRQRVRRRDTELSGVDGLFE